MESILGVSGWREVVPRSRSSSVYWILQALSCLIVNDTNLQKYSSYPPDPFPGGSVRGERSGPYQVHCTKRGQERGEGSEPKYMRKCEDEEALADHQTSTDWIWFICARIT